MLDRHNLLPCLGAAVERSTLIPAQVIDSGAFDCLATVISTSGATKDGAVAARVHVLYEKGAEARAEIVGGTIQVLPLPPGQTARLAVHPRRGIDVGFGPGRPGTLTVNGGILGLVLDGRGRPIRLPADSGRRRELLKKWRTSMGG